MSCTRGRQQSVEVLYRSLLRRSGTAIRRLAVVVRDIVKQRAAQVRVGYALEIFIGKLLAPRAVHRRCRSIAIVRSKSKCYVRKEASKPVPGTDTRGDPCE